MISLFCLSPEELASSSAQMRHILYIWVLVWLGAGFHRSALLVAATPKATNVLIQAPAKARIHAISDPRATSAFIPDSEVVRKLVDRGLLALSGKTNTATAWKVWVKPADVVGFKVISAPGTLTGTRPAVVEALV